MTETVRHDPDPDLARGNALVEVNVHVRAAANLAGVRLDQLAGTGPSGRITLDDVHRAARGCPPPTDTTGAAA